jgi:hypothetical protein
MDDLIIIQVGYHPKTFTIFMIENQKLGQKLNLN